MNVTAAVQRQDLTVEPIEHHTYYTNPFRSVDVKYCAGSMHDLYLKITGRKLIFAYHYTKTLL